jgi:outer membrane protein OmpA-like peptidoglycan-associated protein
MKQNSTLLNEEISKIKKMMSLNGDDVILETTTPAQDKIRGYVDAFYRAYSPWGTNTDGIIAVLNQIPDKSTFLEFYYLLRNLKKRSFEEIINDEFEDDNGPEALKIQQILKSKFNIDSNASVTGTQYMNPRQRMFKKAFKITNLNTTDPNKKDGLSAYMDTTKEPIKDLTQKQPEQTKQQDTTISSQTFNDVIGGKVVLKNIFFETAKFDLKPESIVELDKLVNFLQVNPKLKIEVGGHTDNQGKKQDNLSLSNNRAKAVYDYLVANKIEASRLSYKGYADNQPLVDNLTEPNRSKNRRTEFKILP